MSFTCLACAVRFKTPELQRDHYKQELHRHNLNRRLISLPPMTLEEYENEILAEKKPVPVKKEPLYCKYCSKLFNTEHAYINHLSSKKHMVRQKKKERKEQDDVPSDSDSFVKVTPDVQAAGAPSKFVVLNPDACDAEDIETDSDIEEVCT